MRAPGMWRALNRQRTTGSAPVAPIHDTNRAESPIVRCSLKNLRFETLDPSRHSPLLARAGEREAGLRADLQSDLADLSSGRCLRVRRATAPVCDGLPRLSIVINLAALATFTGANAAHNHSARADSCVLGNLTAPRS